MQRDIAAREVCEQNRGVFFSLDVDEEPVLAGKKLPVSYAEKHSARVISVAGEPDDVAVTSFNLENYSGLLHLIEVLKRVTKLRCPLEVEGRRRGFHPLLDPAHHLVRATVKEQNDLFDHRAVFHLALREYARRFAAMDVVVETGPVRHLPRHVVVA